MYRLEQQQVHGAQMLGPKLPPHYLTEPIQAAVLAPCSSMVEPRVVSGNSFHHQAMRTLSFARLSKFQ